MATQRAAAIEAVVDIGRSPFALDDHHLAYESLLSGCSRPQNSSRIAVMSDKG
jgi:hypothetical protein